MHRLWWCIQLLLGLHVLCSNALPAQEGGQMNVS